VTASVFREVFQDAMREAWRLLPTARYAAIERSGRVVVFEEEPMPLRIGEVGEWIGIGVSGFPVAVPVEIPDGIDWRETLIERYSSVSDEHRHL